MKQEIYVCENCKKEARDEDTLRKENWIETYPDSKIVVWLDEPRRPNSSSYQLSLGMDNREYHFCSPNCLVAILKGDTSI